MVCVWGFVDNLNADFASDAERVQHHASGEEGDNFVHIEKMPDSTGVGGDSESEIDKLRLRALRFFLTCRG